MSEVKKILVYYSVFNIGGAERSTLKLINKLVEKNCEVELLLITKGGTFENQIDSRVKVRHLRSGNFGELAKKAKGFFKFYYMSRYALTLLEQSIKAFQFKFRTYDAVFIGLHGLSPKFCLNNINAKKYFQFIRNDLNLCDVHLKAKNNIGRYGCQIDNFICVSQTALDSFNSVFPQFQHKSIKIYNLLESEKIIQLSTTEPADGIIYKEGNCSILTVCRLQDKSKALLRMLDALSILLEKEYKVMWYIIGDGPDKNEIEDKINKLNLGNSVCLLGPKRNPYPYFLKVDLIAVLSYFEGLCGVVNEAKILERPVIATEFSGINEQIENGINGLIVANDLESIIKGLEEMVKNQILRKKMAINNLPEDLKNDNQKIEMLLNMMR